MFRALLCTSRGGKNCIIQHLVSSHCVGGRLGTQVERVLSQPTDCDNTRYCIIQFRLPDDKHIVLETCRVI